MLNMIGIAAFRHMPVLQARRSSSDSDRYRAASGILSDDTIDSVSKKQEPASGQLQFSGSTALKRPSKSQSSGHQKIPRLSLPTKPALMAPGVIKAELDKHIVGQEQAKKIIATAAYDHAKAAILRVPQLFLSPGALEEVIQSRYHINTRGKENARDAFFQELTKNLEAYDFNSPTDPDLVNEIGTALLEGITSGLLRRKMDATTNPKRIRQDGMLMAKKLAVYLQELHGEILQGPETPLEIQKNNLLMIGPTGVGKTEILRRLAKILDVPFYATTATLYTKEGYQGASITDIFTELYRAADGDLEKAQKGIVYIDEIDKLAPQNGEFEGNDVSWKSVQQSLLTPLEGTKLNIEIENRWGRNETIEFDTTNVLFVGSGSFDGIIDLVKKRLKGGKPSTGFGAEIEETAKDPASKNLAENQWLEKITDEDLAEFGLIKELIGRIPVIVPLLHLTKTEVRAILTEPQHALIKQYQANLAYDGVQLEFDEAALDRIAMIALGRKTGTRALRSILAKITEEVRFHAPMLDPGLKVIVKAGEGLSDFCIESVSPKGSSRIFNEVDLTQ